MKATIKRLPQSEWNFFAVSPREANVAFYYEYARESSNVRNLVQEYRQSYATLNSQPDNYFKDHTEFPPASIKSHRLFRLIRDLALVNEFPEKPWLELDRLQWPENRIQTRPHQLSFVNAFDSTSPELGAMITGKPGIEYKFTNKSIVANPEESIFVIKLDWRLTDEELKRGLATLLLRRPGRRIVEDAPETPKSQLSYDDDARLPFRKPNALQWLGVLRRRNTVGTWSEYFRVYGEDSQRARQADCKQARSILAWFDHGSPLKESDFC